jgi:hypothetical protein
VCVFAGVSAIYHSNLNGRENLGSNSHDFDLKVSIFTTKGMIL